VGVLSGIRTSKSLLCLVAGISLIWACAKGTEIEDAEIVYLSLRPTGEVDAGADAGSSDVDPSQVNQVVAPLEPSPAP
jgi:hypothetical protein